MKTNDMTANREWATRPADQRFASIEELRAYLQARRDSAWELDVKAHKIRLIDVDGDIVFDFAGLPAKFTHWSFGQLSSMAGAPASYLRKLPAGLAIQNLDHGLQNLGNQERVLYFGQENGSDRIMAATSSRYDRYFDIETLEAEQRLEQLAGGNFFTPVARGDKPAGLYASAHDVFIFRCDGGSQLEVPGLTNNGGTQGIYRNIIATGSEVGAREAKFRGGWHDTICGNHIIWGFEQAFVIRARHTGDVRTKLQIENPEGLVKWLKRPASEDEKLLRAATTKLLPAQTHDSLIDWIGKTWRSTTKAQAEAFVKKAEEQDGDCRTYWQLASGVTRYARDLKYADTAEQFQVMAGEIVVRASLVQ